MSLAIGGAFAFGANEAAAQSAHSLTPAETTICPKLRKCLDILDRHGPEEFDYHVLQEAILKTGPAGKSALFRMLSSKDEKAVKRAQILLSKGGIIYEPQYQRQIAALWPLGDLGTHAALMRANLSPVVISRAVETLSHNNAEIRAESHSIIDAAAKSEISPILSQTDYGRLAKVAIAAPSPGMVTLLKNAPAQTSKPILTRILRSSDGPSVIEAYEALFAQDPKAAFQTLVGTLYNLKDTEAKTALALASLLRHRHKYRTDGFYLKFASDIAKDPKMSAMGRLTGFDAIMGSTSKTARLANTPLMVETLKTALANHEDLPQAYAENFYNSAKDNPEPWVNLIWGKLKTDPYKHPETVQAFFGQIAKLPSRLTQNIVSDALNNKRDFAMLTLGIKAVAAQKDKSRLPQLEKLRNHPISDVRAYANLAIQALNNEAPFPENNINAEIRKLNQSSKTCRAVPQDFAKDAKQLPFFDLADVEITTAGPPRTYVRTAVPTRKGWLVGYAAGQAGGDLQFYDNASGNGVPVLNNANTNNVHNNVTAILPVTPQALGQYASEFWAVISHGTDNGSAAIYRLSELNNRFRLTRHAQLPNSHTQISQQANGDVFISFYNSAAKSDIPHPPLLLSKNGGMRRACEDPVNNVLKALP